MRRYARELPRQLDPVAHACRSRSVDTDKKRADRHAAQLEQALREGTHIELRRIAWPDFTKEHCRLIPGGRNRIEADNILKEFGKS